MKNIEDNLAVQELEKTKQPRPWDRITEPIVENLAIFPNRKVSAIKTLFISLFLTTIFAFIKEKRKNLIFEFDELKMALIFTKQGDIYVDDEELSSIMINSVLQKILDKSKNKVRKDCVINCSSFKPNINNSVLKEIKFVNYEAKLINEIFKENNNILFLIGEGFLSKEVFDLNQYTRIYMDNNISWLAVKNKKS